jgi:hypothetical protein
MNEPTPDLSQELRLTEVERVVLRELTERERDADAPRLATSYRRLLELSRSDQPVDAILVAHLARELLSALPGALGIALSHERLEYENLVSELAETWPADVRSSDPPAQTLVELRRLLDEHDRASGRARAGPRALLSREDRARAGYIPDASIDRWTELSRRGSRLAHRLRNLDRNLPEPDEARRLVDELTATLLGTIAPYFAGIQEVDRLLAIENPSAEDARSVAALLRTASQYFYFFERADERWLEPLAGIRRFLTTPPELVDVGGGYVQAPTWPQGRFLARVAGAQPQLVAQLASRVPTTANPRAIAVLVEVMRALPPDAAARLAPGIARRMSTPLAVEYAAVEAAGLVGELGAAGFAVEGAQLLMSTVNAAIASPRDDDWHLEQVLGEPLEAVAAAGAELGGLLKKCIRRLLRGLGERRRYSTLLLRNVDRRPRYGVDAVWFVANALYRVQLAAALDAARQLAAGLLSDREPVLRRVALAAFAERPELVESSDALLVDLSRWDDEGTTRYEFRRALGALWSNASVVGRRGLLDYAEAATEADEIIERLVALDVEHDPGEVRRTWRSRLLYKIREVLPSAWVDRYGPLDPLDDDRLSEPTAEWVGTNSPFPEEELAGLEPMALLARLETWRLPEVRTFNGPTYEGLGRAATTVIAGSLQQFADLGTRIGQLQPVLVAQITSGVQRRLRESEGDDRPSGVELMLTVGEVFLSRGEAGAGELGEDVNTWTREIKRDLAAPLGEAANKELLGEVESRRALDLLGRLLVDPDPTPESDGRDARNGYDAGMLALNSVRGAATTALIELLLECHRTGRTELLEAVSGMLRRVVASDVSRSVRAAIGLRLPWLLARDREHETEWLEILFGRGVPQIARSATWQAYLLYSRFFLDTAMLLAPQYDLAISTYEPRPQDHRGMPRDEDEQLGIHLAAAHVLGLAAADERRWLQAFYARAAGWVRGRVTRWVAEQATNDEASAETRARARSFLQGRVVVSDPEADTEELKAVAWIASATEEEQDILERIVLPALEKTHGATENEPGSVGLAARLSATCPRSAARAIQLLVEGDQWHSLPHVASAELRQALETLVVSDDLDAREIASDVINTLGAQGFLEFRNLLDAGET